ncbi:MAG: hypothetical protein GY882_00525, partial [Actinomycetia bacterium]|nr:hypothetical protein [Actinomycetes bacterium]
NLSPEAFAWIPWGANPSSPVAGTARGIVIEATEDTVFNSYQGRVTLDAGERATVAIYEGTSATGPWSLKAASSLTAVTSASQWVDTGDVHVPVSAGLFYAGVTHSNAAITFVTGTDPASMPSHAFGEIAGGFEAQTGRAQVVIQESALDSVLARSRIYWGREADDDGDGITTCEGDCEDNDASVQPGGVEVCDGVDND